MSNGLKEIKSSEFFHSKWSLILTTKLFYPSHTWKTNRRFRARVWVEKCTSSLLHVLYTPAVRISPEAVIPCNWPQLTSFWAAGGLGDINTLPQRAGHFCGGWIFWSPSWGQFVQWPRGVCGRPRGYTGSQSSGWPCTPSVYPSPRLAPARCAPRG